MDYPSPEQTLKLLGGDAKTISREMGEFSSDAEFFAKEEQRLARQYDGRWIAIYRKEVQAVSDSLQSIIANVKEAGLPMGRVLVRYVSRQPRYFIL